MASLLDSKLGFGLVCALCAAGAVMGVVYLGDSGAPAAPAPAPVKAASWDGPVGPGALAAPAAADSASKLGAAGASGEPSLLDEAGRLKIDPALHGVYDAYLKGSAPREQELRSWLRSRLRQPALAQAESLAGDYSRYLQAEAALRAHERLAQPDRAGMSAAQVEQMIALQQQRAQLRERMLGSAVAQAWFGSEEANCSTALADWRLMRMPADSEEVDSNELRARRLHGAVLEERRNERARSCAAQLMDRLAANGPPA